MSKLVFVPFWGQVNFNDSFARSNTSIANPPSVASLTVLSTMTMLGREVPMGVVVTTQATSSVSIGQARMLVNGSEINAEFLPEFTDATWASALTIRPLSAKTAVVSELLSIQTAGPAFTESSAVTIPWNVDSMNTLQFEVLTFGAPSTITFQSSRASSVPSYTY